jgi:hypothetical protein
MLSLPREYIMITSKLLSGCHSLLNTLFPVAHKKTGKCHKLSLYHKSDMVCGI